MPAVLSGDTNAPRVHGAYIGLDLLGPRSPALTIDIAPPFGAYGNLSGAVAALRSALSPSYTTENPLFIQLSSGSPQLCALARPRKGNDSEIDLPYVLGQMAQTIPIGFQATDPTWYAAGTLDPSVGVPAPLGGFPFNLSFNLTFGGGSEFGAITASNYGDLPCYPLVTFTGPMTTPTLTNASITGSPFIQFGVALNTGDMLVVNFDPKYPSCQYTAAGTSVSASRLYTLSQNSTWFAIVPGTNNLQFTTRDTTTVAGTCAVEYSSAYSAIN